MASDTYDPTFGLLEMATGNDNNSWGTNFINAILAPSVRAMGGTNTITATSGTVDLSTVVPPAGLRLDIDHNQVLTGTLVGDVTVKVVNLSKKWTFHNKTSGAFNVYVQVPGGVSGSVPGIGGLIQIPQGKSVDVYCDGAGNLHRGDRHEIGEIFHHAGSSAPGGAMICNGASLLRAEYPDLYLAHGTIWGSADGTHFTLPKVTDTNRYLRGADGTTITVGTYQSNQNAAHTHTASTSSVTGTTDSQGSHAHNVYFTDVQHSHSYTETPSSFGVANQGGGGGSAVSSSTGATTGGSYTGCYIGSSPGVNNSTTTTNGAHTHNVSGTAAAQTISSSGGTEARPESAAVLICIRY